MRTWIKNPLDIFAQNAKGGIIFENDKIVQILNYGEAPTTSVDSIIDASEHVVLPGLINTHHHYFQTLTRAFKPSLNKELFEWLTTLYGYWKNITEKECLVANKTAMAELLLSGCTTSANHHYLYSKNLQNCVDLEIEAAKELGIRAVATRGSMSLSKKDGGLPPDEVVQNEDEILNDSEQVIKKYHQNYDGAMVQIALSPCSPFSVTKELMKQTAVMAQKHNVSLHTHLAETKDEENFCKKMFGLRPLDYLEDVGWLNEKTWLAHSIHFNENEFARLAKAKVGFSHCPSSNMVLSSGVFNGHLAKKLDLKVSIAVDGSASNDHSNMISELRTAFLLQRLNFGTEITHLDILNWATKGGASVLGRNDIGTLEVGKQADIAMFKMDDLRFSGADDALCALILCGAQKADKVFVAGKMVVADGELLNFDIKKHKNEHLNASTRIKNEKR